MPKAEWGTKRICPTTGKRFYDLNKSPIVSPYTGEIVDIESVRRKMAASVISRAVPDKDDDVRKLRGAQLTWAWVNEMKEIPKSIIDMLQARVDRYPAQGSSRWVGVRKRGLLPSISRGVRLP